MGDAKHIQAESFSDVLCVWAYCHDVRMNEVRVQYTPESSPTSEITPFACGSITGSRCVNSDNTLLSNVTVRDELRSVRKIRRMTDAYEQQLIHTGHEAASTRFREK